MHSRLFPYLQDSQFPLKDCADPVRTPVKSLPVPNSARAAGDAADIQTNLHQTGVRSATKHLLYPRNYCRESSVAPGDALGSTGSWALQHPLSRCRRIRLTTWWSVIKETMRMRPPQLNSRGSASEIFLIRRAHVLRASLEKREFYCSRCIAAAQAELLVSAGDVEIRAWLEKRWRRGRDSIMTD
jgi:hypothetical protein